jgi:hypothetical protein
VSTYGCPFYSFVEVRIMPFNVSNEAEVNTLEILRAAIEAGTVHLLGVDVLFDQDLVLATLTAGESTAAGYVAPSAGTWSAAVTGPDGVAFIDSAIFTFSSTEDPPVDVFGWYVTTAAGAYLFGARFAGAPLPFGLGNDIPLMLRYQLRERV